MAPLDRGLALLESAVRYAVTNAGRAAPPLLARSTPCTGWDLRTLLDHLSDSMEILHAAMAHQHSGAHWALRSPACLPVGRVPDPVARLRARADRLLGVCADARLAEHLVAIGDRELTASMVPVSGALEVTAHGWDIAAACGSSRPVPPGLAAVLLPIAPLLVTPDIRPGLFAGPVLLLAPACPGDQLIAFLGRQPRFRGAPQLADS